MGAIITTDPKHVPFLRQAYQVAYTRSDDPDTCNGALLVNKDGESVLIRANQIPYGIKMTPTRLIRPTKYTYIEHAERYVIYGAAHEGIRTNGATLYVPWAACVECARAIISSGIRQVVGHKAMADKTPERWRVSIETAFQMFEEAGVEMLLYDGKIGEVKALFDGAVWEP